MKTKILVAGLLIMLWCVGCALQPVYASYVAWDIEFGSDPDTWADLRVDPDNDDMLIVDAWHYGPGWSGPQSMLTGTYERAEWLFDYWIYGDPVYSEFSVMKNDWDSEYASDWQQGDFIKTAYNHSVNGSSENIGVLQYDTRGFGPLGSGSGVPEPATVVGLGLMVIAAGLRRMKRGPRVQ